VKIVSTQEELDQLREVPAGEEVEIRSGKTLSLNYDIEVRGFIRIEARLEYNARAVLWGNASAELWDNARAELRGNASAELWGNARAELWDNARAMLRVPPGYRRGTVLYECDRRGAKIRGGESDETR